MLLMEPSGPSRWLRYKASCKPKEPPDFRGATKPSWKSNLIAFLIRYGEPPANQKLAQRTRAVCFTARGFQCCAALVFGDSRWSSKTRGTPMKTLIAALVATLMLASGTISAGLPEGSGAV